MRGSLLMTFDSSDGIGGDNYRVFVNGELRDLHYTSSVNLYSTFLELGDVVNIQITGDTSVFKTFTVNRTDFTTDNEAGDNGIKETIITSISQLLPISITFTAATRTDAYNYHYGVIDTDCFNIGTGFDGSVTSMNIDSNNKILLGGNFTSYSGVTYKNLIRLEENGFIDNTFIIGTGFNPVFTSVQASNIQSDGKILAGGSFTSYSGISQNYLVRLNSNGSFDSSFNANIPSSPSGNNVTMIKVQSDGKILYSNATNLDRVNSDGTIDGTFTHGELGGSGNRINNIVIQPDNKLICTGPFTIYNSQSYNRIIRLNSNGTIDNTFNIGTGFNAATEPIILQSDGKIVVAGPFTSYSGQSYNRIIRLNSNGSIDNTFNIGTGFNSQFGNPGIFDMDIQPDGKIICVGSFETYNGNTSVGIIRLNSNGSIDNTFNSGTGFNNLSVYNVRILSNGKILVSGGFTTYNGLSSNGIIRLNSDGTENICP